MGRRDGEPGVLPSMSGTWVMGWPVAGFRTSNRRAVPHLRTSVRLYRQGTIREKRVVMLT